MCGIIGLFNIHNEQAMRAEALKMVRKIRHRGPDWSGSYSDKFCVIKHERLSMWSMVLSLYTIGKIIGCWL